MEAPRLVRDLMKVGVATCGPDETVASIAKFLVEKNLEAIIVLDKIEGHALGVVGQDELVKAFTQGNAENRRAEDVMRDGVPQVPPEIPLEAAVQIMQDQDVRALFIMHHSGGIEYPAAYISYQHILRWLAGEDVRDLGIQADRESPLEAFIKRRDAARRKIHK